MRVAAAARLLGRDRRRIKRNAPFVDKKARLQVHVVEQVVVVVRRHAIGAQARECRGATSREWARNRCQASCWKPVVGDEHPVLLQDIQVGVIDPYAMGRRHRHVKQPEAFEILHRREAAVALAAFAHFLLGLGQVDVQAQVGATHDVQNVAANRLGGQVLEWML